MHKCLDQVWSVVRGNIKFAWIGVNEHGAKVITRNNFEVCLVRAGVLGRNVLISPRELLCPL